ncbi:Tetratricopeptide repeat protein [Hibiscus syriacus]|uniref:Tetratricopeptide repeat protein 38 n=1 Tax=Hibiscus syriacus TaxID=106335 RepID=A0A6A3A4A6_HIBSY|nr:tetratricopeptide repeat protein 38-like [Hibiscus syriacus]KAE8698883.1 Tetratricopeptide repeat protein [Hibiscus syriacus]
MEGLKLDKWGYEVKTSSDSCISAINDYYHQVLAYGRNRKVILDALVHDKDCVLANILAAHFLHSSDPSKADPLVEAAKSRIEQATSYEKAVFEAINYLLSHDRDDDIAVELHSKLLRDFPRDLVSLKRAQILCFYMGRADLSLDLVQQVLPQNQQENYIYGMLAFPLLELGRMADAEDAAKKGFEINKQDFWSQHALCHVLQYECRYKEAVQFMEECSKSWSPCSSFMLTHNWWHAALCYLEGHSPITKVREIYDDRIWKELERTDAVPVEVYLNALGLLLRVYVRGKLDVFEDQLQILAAFLRDQANWFLEWHLDLLIIWALAFIKELSKADDLLKGLKLRLSKMSKKKQQIMQRAMQLAEAVYEFGRGNEKQALEILGPDFDAYMYKVIGASNEQVDVFNEIWYVMLLNTGQATKAIESIEKQIKKRDGDPFLWRLLEKGYKVSGRPEAATIGEKASVLETAYFN